MKGCYLLGCGKRNLLCYSWFTLYNKEFYLFKVFENIYSTKKELEA